MSILQGWHRGENALQRKLGFSGPMALAYTWIEAEMPEQHRVFYSHNLPFVPVTTLDESGRPWASIFAAHSGKPGFITSPSWNKLTMDIEPWDGDPFLENVKHWDGNKMLLAGLGIEFSTRRRNKFAGHVFDIRKKGNVYRLQMIVDQAIGNCPKYINVRELVPHPDHSPVVVYRQLHMSPKERLPDEVIKFIQSADTVFLATSYEAREYESAKFPSHVGHNSRGGRPGFIRVRPSDGRTIVMPDYSGNRLVTSLGNIEATPVAGMTFVNFETGDVLYVSGNARNLVGEEAKAVMPRQNCLTENLATGFVLVRDALPCRAKPGAESGRSPYSPPIRLLAEESDGSSLISDEASAVIISRIRIHSRDLATFTFEAMKPLHIIPGQTAILDFSNFVGVPEYSHMAPTAPSSLNDDRIRTWTVSSADLSEKGTQSFDLTMREKPGGAVTGALFTVARKLAEMRPDLLNDTKLLGIRVNLVGIAGSFTLSTVPQSTSGQDSRQLNSMLWLAGGIGVTPYISMLTAIMNSPKARDVDWDIVLALSSREPDVLLPLLTDLLKSDSPPNLHLDIHVFSKHPLPPLPDSLRNRSDGLSVSLIPHKGRVGDEFMDSVSRITTRTTYMCGAEEFERSMLDLLAKRGVATDRVVRESFEY